jgi:hypothetical protein
MKAHTIIFTDKVLFGEIIPKEFVEFAHGILSPRDVDAQTLDETICSFPKENFNIVRDYLLKIISSSYSDYEIMKIFQISGARIVYKKPSQRVIAQQILNVIIARSEGKISNISAYPSISN